MLFVASEEGRWGAKYIFHVFDRFSLPSIVHTKTTLDQVHKHHVSFVEVRLAAGLFCKLMSKFFTVTFISFCKELKLQSDNKTNVSQCCCYRRRRWNIISVVVWTFPRQSGLWRYFNWVLMLFVETRTASWKQLLLSPQ